MSDEFEPNPYARIRAAVEAQQREPDRLDIVLAEISDLRQRIETLERREAIRSGAVDSRQHGAVTGTCMHPDCTVTAGNECPHGVLIGGIGATIDRATLFNCEPGRFEGVVFREPERQVWERLFSFGPDWDGALPPDRGPHWMAAKMSRSTRPCACSAMILPHVHDVDDHRIVRSVSDAEARDPAAMSIVARGMRCV